MVVVWTVQENLKILRYDHISNAYSIVSKESIDSEALGRLANFESVIYLLEGLFEWSVYICVMANDEKHYSGLLPLGLHFDLTTL